MNNYALIGIILVYLGLLFYLAFYAEKKSKGRWSNNPYVYTLSLAVYCSAWTYYGSVGIAANSGVNFLPIYLGPVLAAPLWVMVLRKIISISKQHHISSIADFISLRYGNNRFIGALITVICALAMVPYIALQLKAISETFQIMTYENQNRAVGFDDSTFYIALILAIFATFFGTRTTDATEKRRGIVATVAFESILKLVFFLMIGIYVTFFLFDGTDAIYQQVAVLPDFEDLVTIGGLEGGFNWFFTIMLSFSAIFLLPRQFQMSVVENSRIKHLKNAIWFFPLYLLLFNIFVIFIAWGGKLTFDPSVNADYYTLLLPLQNGNVFLALLVFIGGFSAVISMVVVSTLVLSNMISNNLIIPYGFLNRFIRNNPDKNSRYIKNIRRISIFSIILVAYWFYISFSIELSLYSIGLISFVMVAQMAPSFFIGLYWNRGTSKAAIIGLLTGFAITLYTLILPFTIEAFTGSRLFTDNGVFGLKFSRPHALFGLDFLSPPVHAFFWSILVNTLSYLIFSLVLSANYRERNYAEMFVDSQNFNSLQEGAFVWKGEAYVSDIKIMLERFLGVPRTERALNLFFLKYKLPNDTNVADARLINFSEKLLTGSIGSASAKILIDSIVKEQEVSLREVLEILHESKETIATNKQLEDQSKTLRALTNKLQNANEELRLKDMQKDEFLDTVAHELKTPVTGIRAATELLLDDEDDMPDVMKKQFLNNILQDSDRLSRLIHNILDFEKLATGREKLHMQNYVIDITIKKAIRSVQHMADRKGVRLKNLNSLKQIVKYDEDRILQVFTNLLSNAIKFSETDKGLVTVESIVNSEFLYVYITDNGKGIDEEDFDYIFDKFYQSKNQNTKKPIGSGLGLAISAQIIQRHQGRIWAERRIKSGARFGFKLPIS
ncbi:MAG: ATP-binding protein [Flavobacteriaceae bacterium]|nr:ATP-binding protein [Flavobacteriaceae bacterium]